MKSGRKSRKLLGKLEMREVAIEIHGEFSEN